jgi:hypothetical protein
LHSEACQGCKLRVTRFIQRVKVFDVISTGDHGAVSVREIEILNKIEEQDFHGGMDGRSVGS